MNVLECIRTRRAIRDFAEREVPDEVLRAILEAGRLAPSARNTQPWEFIVIRAPERLAQLSRLTSSGPHLAKAPLAIAVAMLKARYPEVDAARAIQNMTLVAWEHGVGSCWIGNWEAEKAKALLGLPADSLLISVVPFGYPREGASVARKKQRRPLHTLVHRELYGTPYYGEGASAGTPRGAS